MSSPPDDGPAPGANDATTIITIRFRNEQLSVPVPPNGTLTHLKRKIEDMTGVQVEHQKLLGLKPLAEDAPLPPVTKKLMLINAAPRAPTGNECIDTELPKDQVAVDDDDRYVSTIHVSVEVVNRLLGVYCIHSGDDEADAPITNDPDELRATLQRRIASAQVTILNPPRPGAHCLVR